jgi:hypothetical protein
LLTAGGHLFTGSTVGAGTYVVDVSNNDSSNTTLPTLPTSAVPLDGGGPNNDTDRFLVLNATGTVRKASRRIQTVVRMPISLFNYGVWCDTGGTISGAGYVDAYNSNSGAYGGGNVSSTASVFCNGGLGLSGSAHIDGSCTVGDTSCTGGSGVTPGPTVQNAPTQTRTAPACPAGGYPTAAAIPEPSTYDPATGDLRSDGALVLPVPPTSYYFSKVTVSGSNSIAFDNPSGLHVDVYVSGALTVSGGSFVNPAAPALLGIWACGAATNNWTISGGSNAHFTLYAPTRAVTLSGTSPFFGAIVAKDLTNSGGSMVHQDLALASAGIPSVVGRTWREIFP